MSQPDTPRQPPHNQDQDPPETPHWQIIPAGQGNYPEYALRNNLDYTTSGDPDEHDDIDAAIIRNNGNIQLVLFEMYGNYPTHSTSHLPFNASSQLANRIQTVLAQHAAEQKAQKEKEAKAKKPKKQTKMDIFLKRKDPDPDGDGGAGAGATGVFGGRKTKKKRKRKRKTKRFRKKKKTKRRKRKRKTRKKRRK